MTDVASTRHASTHAMTSFVRYAIILPLPVAVSGNEPALSRNPPPSLTLHVTCFEKFSFILLPERCGVKIYFSCLFQDSQKEPQNANSSMRKTKSAVELINTKSDSLVSTAAGIQEKENLPPKAKAIKKELVTAKTKINETTVTKPPSVTVKDENGRVPVGIMHCQERMNTLTGYQVQSIPDGCVNLSLSQISPLSSTNGTDSEVKVEEQNERKTKVRFNTETICATETCSTDLSETQTAMERDATFNVTEQRKENFQPEVRHNFY